jgi:cytoskeletal protein RodZ
VSSRYEGDPHEPVLAEEDDWFATPFQEPSDTDEIAWQDEEPELPPRRAPDGLAQRQIVVVLAVVAVVALIAILILIVRAVSGDDTTPPVTAPTVTQQTSPTTTAGTTTTPTTSTKTTPTTTTPATAVTSVPTDQSLKPGMSGSSVTTLQQALTQLGYDAGTADGSYGPSTTQAVTAFQTDKGLTQDGVAGPATLAAINTALSAG